MLPIVTLVFYMVLKTNFGMNMLACLARIMSDVRTLEWKYSGGYRSSYSVKWF